MNAAVPTKISIVRRKDVAASTARAEDVLAEKDAPQVLSDLGFRGNMVEVIHIPHDTNLFQLT